LKFPKKHREPHKMTSWATCGREPRVRDPVLDIAERRYNQQNISPGQPQLF